jgi:hypothetical protein
LKLSLKEADRIINMSGILGMVQIYVDTFFVSDDLERDIPRENSFK